MATVLRPPVITRVASPPASVAITAQDAVWSNSLLTLFASVQAPFAQRDWPNPLRVQVVRNSADDVWSNRLLDLFSPAGAITIFRLPSMVPIARPSSGVAITAQDEVWSNRLLTLFTAPPKPFALYDWPNPSVRVSSIELRTWLQNLLVSTLSGTPSPFAQLHWPNPGGPLSAIELRTLIGNLLENTLGIVPPAPPGGGRNPFPSWMRRWYLMDLRN